MPLEAPAGPTAYLPTLNAILNSLSALFLVLGFLQIRRGRAEAHRNWMAAALATSTLFLLSYLVYHFQVGSVRFRGEGWIRGVYFSVLISHTILAAVIVPLVLLTVARALKRNFAGHRGIARWTLPLWLYVSVTGVVVYWMLYHL
jgi:putative membrane protein